MHELICPNCKKPFTVNEDDYAAILSQVKGAEFNAEIDRRIAELHKQQEAEQKARDAQAGQEHQKELSAKDKVIGETERWRLGDSEKRRNGHLETSTSIVLYFYSSIEAEKCPPGA